MIGVLTSAVHFPVLPLAVVDVAIGKNINTLAALFVVEPFSFILVAIVIAERTYPSLSTLPFPFFMSLASCPSYLFPSA